MSKSRDAFRTISEVAELLDTPAHVLRFWESKFTQLKPVKRAGGRRYYRPGDIGLLSGIKKLLHDDGMTIKGVQKVLREKGVKHVSALAPLPLDDEDDIAELVEDAPYTEAEPETGTVLPFAPAQPAAPPAEEPAPVEMAEEEPSEPQAPADAEPEERIEAMAEPLASEDDVAVPEDVPEESPPAAMLDTGPETAPEMPHEAFADEGSQETEEDPAEEAHDQADLFAEGAPSEPVLEDNGADLPDFLSQSLEERADAQGDEPAAAPEIAPADESPAPAEPDLPPLEPESAVTALPEESSPEPLPAEEAAPEPPTAIVIPEVPPLADMPPPPPGILSYLARVERLSPEQAQALAPQMAALRALAANAGRRASR
ncbi:MerR family transcriptional regulator [Salipiger abyssi]|uniref:MerR family transcriptional regulator n=1 Tax=Salipiger abyssi TaxID=1250539 RepID=UPI001A9022A7|nr:MerR family transcriptional regulator [Salipiger abyssi]MBN9886601.1 MerR family transcriptional regulator [Salipiger abyssi]